MLKVKKCWHHLLWSDIISFSVTRKGQKNLKNRWKLMKIADIDREILHIFWTTWGISMKFPGNMWLMIILKVTKNHSFTLSLENKFFNKFENIGCGLIIQLNSQ